MSENGDLLTDNGYYLFMEDFTAASCAKVIRWIMNENMSPKKKNFLTLVINSPGGDVNACFALIDTMKGSSIPIRTVGVGQIASCGFITFIAGQPGHRVLTPNTSILSHQYSWGAVGKEHELYAIHDEYRLTTERILRHYEKCLPNLSRKQIKKNLLPASDVWLSATDALKLGCCDKIKEVY